MGYASSPRALALVQLCVVVVSCFFYFTVFGEEIQALPPNPHHYYPVEAPSHPPSHPPSHHHHHHHPHPPAASPAHPPTTHPHVPVPSPSHHHHYHHHIHPPSPAPVHPPTHTPVHPPTHTPLHPPTHTPVQPPSHPPTHNTPTHPPAHPPTQPPSHPPTHKPAPSLPPRKFVAVQGVVYCKKTCNYAGKHTLLGASPLLGGTVRLYCKNTKYSLKLEAKTDKNGYFFIAAPDSITSYGAHKCTVSLGSSPLASCQKPSELHGGFKGSFLRPEKPIFYLKRPYLLYSVGPFVFEPKC